MSIALSIKIFLSLFATLMVACPSFTAAGAMRLRSRRQEQEDRSLKSTKGNNNYNNDYDNDYTAPSNSYTGDWVITEVHPLSIEGFGRKCPNHANALDGCIGLAGGNDSNISLCKTCVMGIAHLSSATIHNLNSCSDPNVNGGHCRECYEEAKNYYNCGTDSNLGNEDTSGIDAKLSSVTITHTDPVPPNNNNNPPSPTAESEIFVSPIQNLNPGCPPEVPVSGNTCPYSGDYFSCIYMTSSTSPPIQCRCNDDGLFYCRNI